MLVFWKERLVILATPKTGTTAIETALESLADVAMRRPPEMKHLSARRYRRHFSPLIEAAVGKRFDAVALMREPIDWLGSWYRYRSRDALMDTERSTRGLSFDAAVRGYLASPPISAMNVGSQANFLCDGRGRPAVDRIFRYEAIDVFVHFLEERLGCEIILPRVNVSPEGPLGLEAETETALRERQSLDFQLYGSLV